jgi:Mg2+ and Co2+ transporter CorA
MESAMSGMNLRRLFRVLDGDNDRFITRTELSHALVAMRLVSPTEDLLVGRLLSEMDRNRTSVVSEEEFVGYFRGLTPAGLKMRIDRIRGELDSGGGVGVGLVPSGGEPEMRVTCVEFGCDFGHGRFARFAICRSGSSLLDWLRFVRGRRTSCLWIDVQGFDVALLQGLGEVFGYSLETAKDAAVYQRAKAEVVRGVVEVEGEEFKVPVVDDEVQLRRRRSTSHRPRRNSSAGVSSVAVDDSELRFQCLLHRIWLSEDSLPILPSGGGERVDLRARKDLAAHPPELFFSQTSIIVVDDWTVLTIRGTPEERPDEVEITEEHSSEQLDATCCGCFDDVTDSCCWGSSCCWDSCCWGPKRRSSGVQRHHPATIPASDLEGLTWKEALKRAALMRQGSLDNDDDDDEDDDDHDDEEEEEEVEPWGPKLQMDLSRNQIIKHLGDFAGVAKRLERGGAGLGVGGGTQAVSSASSMLLGSPQTTSSSSAAAVAAASGTAGLPPIPKPSLAGPPPSTSLAPPPAPAMASSPLTESPVPLFSTQARALSVELIDAMLDKCFLVRDVLKDWQEAIEESLTQPGTVPVPRHTAHIFSLSKTAELYERSLQPLLNDLRSVEVKQFFLGLEPELGDSVDDLDTVLSDVRGTMSVATKLRELYSSLSNDMMNRALFLLTITTTTFLPVQLLSGVFGMNFQFMPELGWEYSYLVFWLFALLCVLLIVRAFAVRGFFALYSTSATIEQTQPTAPPPPDLETQAAERHSARRSAQGADRQSSAHAAIPVSN